MESRRATAVAVLVLFGLLASVPFSGSVTPAHESTEFVGVAPDSSDAYQGATSRADLEDTEAIPIGELSPAARHVIETARSSSVSEPSGQSTDWHTTTVGLCRETVIWCDGLREWPAALESEAAHGWESLDSKTTAHYLMVSDGDDQLVVQTRTTGGGFLLPSEEGVLFKTLAFVPFAVFLLGITVKRRKSQPEMVYQSAGVGALLVLWGLIIPSAELLAGIDPVAHASVLVSASWLAILVGVGRAVRWRE